MKESVRTSCFCFQMFFIEDNCLNRSNLNRIKLLYLDQIPESHDNKHWWEYMDNDITLARIEGIVNV